MPSVAQQNLGRKAFGVLTNQPCMIPREISEFSRSQQLGQLPKLFLGHFAMQPLRLAVFDRPNNSIISIPRYGNAYVLPIPLPCDYGIVIRKPNQQFAILCVVRLLRD
jgi:hypothetical protein